MARIRIAVVAFGLVLLPGACGSGESSLTDYVEQINELAADAGRKAELMIADVEQITDFTPQDLEATLERSLGEIRIPLQEAVDELEPPIQVAGLHSLLWSWHSEFIAIEEALAVRAGTAADTAADWEALSDSPEMQAYRDALAAGKEVCTDFQAELDATSERGVFAEAPWIPAEMKEAVEGAIGCVWFPENPQDVYRYPPPTP